MYVGSNLTRITTQLLKIDDKMAFLYLTAVQQYFTVLQILGILMNKLKKDRFLKRDLRDHPFKTSACFRGEGEGQKLAKFADG